MIWETFSTSSAETERLGRLLGKRLKGAEVIELRSDLGGGKTTFVKGLVKGAGSKDSVTSPTFTLSRIYNSSTSQIHHFDFYRLNDPGILAGQLSESISDNKSIVIVEWGGVVEEVLPANRITIKFEPVASSPDERKITVSYPGSAQDIITKLRTEWDEIEP